MIKLPSICPLMLLASLCRFSQLPSVAVSPQLVPDSYLQFEDIEQATELLRKQTAEAKTHSFSRDWFDWELLLRRYIDEGRRDQNALKILSAYFRGAIFDRYCTLDAKGEGEMFYIFNTSMDATELALVSSDKVFKHDVHGGGSHGGWGSHARMLIYEELVKQEVLNRQEQTLFEKIVVQSLSPNFLDFNRLERGANNRPYKNTGGIAAAIRIFPQMPRVKELELWIDRQWRELAEHGDIFEVNHFPYGGLHLSGIFDIASETGKIKELDNRKLVYTIAKRYLLMNHGMGVRGNPNSAAQANVNFTTGEMFDDPWHAPYYGDILIPDFWYRVAQEFRDSEFLWAAVQTSIGPEPIINRNKRHMYKQWKGAYTKRFGWFIEHGIEPQIPQAGSSIAFLSPDIHHIPERLYLCTGREPEQPFASFYLFDRNNEYMHCFGDAMGRLYEYCVDGAKLIGSSGKYNGIFMGQAYYDMLMVRHPDDAFPMHTAMPEYDWGHHPFLDQAANVWRRSSCSLPSVTHSRTGPDSKNWRYAPELHDHWTWRRIDDPVGGSAANMDGLMYLNDDYTLYSVTLRLNGSPDENAKPDRVVLRNLRLSGPKGDIMLADFSQQPDNFQVTRRKLSNPDGEWKRVDPTPVTMITEDGQGALEVSVEAGYSYALRQDISPREFNLAEDYTRVSFEFKGNSQSTYLRYRQGWRYGQTGAPALVSDMILNDRTVVPSHDVRGGILEPDSVLVEDRDGDSFGGFTYRNYFGARSTWTRHTLLTREGFLIVRDIYVACSETAGYRVGPVWCLRADGKWVEREDGDLRRRFQNMPPTHDGKRHWFEAPAFDHASWQTETKRLLVYIHPAADQTYGQLQHESTPDFSREVNTNSSWTASIVKGGQPKAFLSVVIPFSQGQDVADLLKNLETNMAADGGANVKIRKTTITLSAAGNWAIQRN